MPIPSSIQFLPDADFTQVLYSRDGVGNIRVWGIEAYQGSYRTFAGVEHGAIQCSKWTKCVGKNIGKSNATTARLQAINEAMAKAQKRIELGEVLRRRDVDKAVGFYFPMLAQKFEDRDDMVYPAYIQPKLDGIRCIATFENGKVVLRSRTGKPFVSCPHIADALRSVFDYHGENIAALDGELYNHALHDNFNDIVSMVRTSKPTQDDLYRCRETVEYHVYDMIPRKPTPFTERIGRLRGAFVGRVGALSCLKLVNTFQVESPQQAVLYCGDFMEKNYEGAMIRSCDADYETGTRSRHLLKMKRFNEDEYPIVQIFPGQGNRTGLATKVTVRLPDGKTSSAGVMGGDNYTRRLYDKRKELVGQLATIKYQNLTPDGYLRCAKMKVIRNYE